jgi:hypothetical protein
MRRTWCRLSKTNATTPGQALYWRHVASTEALAVPRASDQMRAFRWRSFNPRHAANFGYFTPIWRNVPPRFLQQSDVCFCFRSEMLLLRDRLQLWTEFWRVSDRCRLTTDQFRHLTLLSVEGPPGAYLEISKRRPYSRPQKFATFFCEANICRSFLENDQLINLATFLYSLSPILQFSNSQPRSVQRGGIRPPTKKFSHQPKGDHGTMAPPNYASEGHIYLTFEMLAAECRLWTACKWDVLSVLAEETSSVNTEEIFADVTVTVRVKLRSLWNYPLSNLSTTTINYKDKWLACLIKQIITERADRMRFSSNFISSVYSFFHLLPQSLVNCTYALTPPPPPQRLNEMLQVNDGQMF